MASVSASTRKQPILSPVSNRERVTVREAVSLTAELTSADQEVTSTCVHVEDKKKRAVKTV